MIKIWKIVAELNWDASNYKSIIVKANTERKARIIGEEKLKKEYSTNNIKILNVERIQVIDMQKVIVLKQ